MEASLLIQLLIATAMVVITVLIHGAGLFGLARALRIEAEEERRIQIHLTTFRGLFFTLCLVLCLFALHGLEIWAYGILYYWSDALPNLMRAIYFSTITYGTIGYDDEGLTHGWEMVAAIEGINGIILLGWSTAFFVTVVQRIGTTSR